MFLRKKKKSRKGKEVLTVGPKVKAYIKRRCAVPSKELEELSKKVYDLLEESKHAASRSRAKDS